jgi:hypothetical protein
MIDTGFFGEIRPLNWRPSASFFRWKDGRPNPVVMTGNWFIGHVGGDDFVVILPAEKAEDVSR